jgi:hypothetical protein
MASKKQPAQPKESPDTKTSSEAHDDHSCCGGHCHSHEQPDLQQIVYGNHVLLHTLVGMLIKKGAVSDEELRKELERVTQHQH